MKQRLNLMQTKINGVVREIMKIEKASKSALRELNEKVGDFTVNQQIEALKLDFDSTKAIIDYLDEISKDIIQNLGEFLGASVQQKESGDRRNSNHNFFKRYKINVFAVPKGCR